MRIWTQQRHGQNSRLQDGIGVQNAENRMRELLLLFESQHTLRSLQEQGLRQPEAAFHCQSSSPQCVEELQPLVLLPQGGRPVQGFFPVEPRGVSSGRSAVQLLFRGQSGLILVSTSKKLEPITLQLT